jgi:phenylalanyl-tRNA synthetase beta chain
MPTLSVERDALFQSIGKTYTDEAFDELCFEFGVELDEITSEREEALKSATVKLSKEHIASLSQNVSYKIDVPANRYDLLCIEGLSRALKIFLGDMDAPSYQVLTPNNKDSDNEDMHVITVMPSTAQIRPFVVCAILRDVVFTEERYNSFIDLQDQLHRNLCRQRTLVAIGTHDMDTVQGPFIYDALPGEEIEFVPLTHSSTGESFNGKALLEHYETEPACKHLKPYVPIIKDSPVYPVVLDSNKTVMSLPPIINGSKSKITLGTTNVFIECTATDLTKANIVLDTVVAMFSEYCAKPFTVEPVRVNFVDQQGTITKSYITPEMFTRKESAKVDFVNSMIGINISAEQMVQLCNKIQLGPASLIDSNTLEVTVPPTRSDILHAVDIAEDIGIAFGYNNIVKRIPTTCTVGGEQPLNAMGDLLRDEIARAGYIEVLTHGLCSIRDNFTALRRKVSPAVSLSNPANVEYQVVRTTLLPGLLKTLQHNKSASFTSGFKLFEISDVVLPDDEHVVTDTIVGAKNRRKLCAVYAGPTSGFEIIHGLVDRVMTLTEVAPEQEYIENSAKGLEEKYRVAREGWYYTIRELKEDGGHSSAHTYFPGRAAEVLVTKPGSEKHVSIGTFGILHPEVLSNFDVQYPASCLELDLEILL